MTKHVYLMLLVASLSTAYAGESDMSLSLVCKGSGHEVFVSKGKMGKSPDDKPRTFHITKGHLSTAPCDFSERLIVCSERTQRAITSEEFLFKLDRFSGQVTVTKDAYAKSGDEVLWEKFNYFEGQCQKAQKKF